MKVFLFCRAEKRHIFLSAIKKTTNIYGIILWHYEYYRFSSDELFCNSGNEEDYNYDDTIIISESEEEKKYLLKSGIKENQIIVLFSRFPEWKLFKFVPLHRWLLLKIVYDSRFKRCKKIKKICELRIMDFLCDYFRSKGTRFVTMGTGDYYQSVIQRVKNMDLYAGSYKLDGEEGDQKSVFELAYEDIENVIVLILRLNIVRKTEEILLDMGFTYNQLYVVGDTRDNCDCGSAPMDVYDGRLGYTRIIDGIPGFVVFENKKSDSGTKPFKVMCLGGSTSDPTTANVKSWSECLYEILSAMKIDVKVWAGGISSYSVEQETDKLIRDGMIIQPDLVISYSGVNNYLRFDNDFLHPSIKTYQEELIFDIFRKRNNKSNLQKGVVVSNVTFGLDNHASLAEKWVQSERIMSAICREFGFGFLGFLQPSNEYGGISIYEEELKQIEAFYSEAKMLIADCENIYDFTHIFDGEDVFFDRCHTYEKGNRLIAKRMLPYVLKEIKKREKKL